jgi:hypothetical protein
MGKSTFKKMEKEKARKEKQKEKEARRHQAKVLNSALVSRTGDEDPDIAGIKPGPQPLPEPWKSIMEE